MRIALAQINSHLGNFENNFNKIVDYCHKAKERRADIVVFPEAALFGYHPMDLLRRKEFIDQQLKFINKIKSSIPDKLTVVFGAFTKNESKQGRPLRNTAVILEKKGKVQFAYKELLPMYDVFDDARHIEPGNVEKNIFTIHGKKILFTICEDIWAWGHKGEDGDSRYGHNPLTRIKNKKIDLIINLSASPYFSGKDKLRLSVAQKTVKHFRVPMVYVNMVGAQDELIFDGGSFALDKNGKVKCQCSRFIEDLNIFEFPSGTGGSRVESKDIYDDLRQALVLGIRDFLYKTGQQKIHIGLSGGVDSALVACLAVDALGAKAVTGFALPGPFNSPDSLQWAEKLASNLGIDFKNVPINSVYNEVIESLETSLGKTEFGLMHENIQARIRAIILMAYSNKASSLLLNTSNKSELASGYGTLYGDLAGALSPIGDLVKSDVYKICEIYNKEHELIPNEILTRAPSAELRPNQKDQDTLPEYDDLDHSVREIVEQAKFPKTKSDQFLYSALLKSEFKRWQSPPILKVKAHSFGRGRRMPIAFNYLK